MGGNPIMSVEDATSTHSDGVSLEKPTTFPWEFNLVGGPRQARVLSTIFGFGGIVQLIGPAVGGLTYRAVPAFPALVPSIVGAALAALAIAALLAFLPETRPPRHPPKADDDEAAAGAPPPKASSKLQLVCAAPLRNLILLRAGFGFMGFMMIEVIPLFGIATAESAGLALDHRHLGMLLAAAACIGGALPRSKATNDSDTGGVEPPPPPGLLRNARVWALLGACALANSDYALLEPSLGAHAAAHGLASGAASVGALFALASAAYTLACPLAGWLAARERLGPRLLIVGGLVLQAGGLVLVGPSPLLGGGVALGHAQLLAALVLLGVGEAMAMTPALDALIGASGGDASEATVNALSGAMAAATYVGTYVKRVARSSASE